MPSSTSGRLTLQTLPMELLCLICRLLNHRTLRRLRLTARFFKDLALAEMFRIRRPPDYIYLAPYRHIVRIFLAMAKSPLQSYCTTLHLRMDGVPADEEPFGSDLSEVDYHEHYGFGIDLPRRCLDSIMGFKSIHTVRLDTSVCPHLGSIISMATESVVGTKHWENICVVFGEALRIAVLSNTISAGKAVLAFDEEASMPRFLIDSLKPGLSEIVHLEIVDDRRVALDRPTTYSATMKYAHEPWMSALTTAPKIQELSFTWKGRPTKKAHRHRDNGIEGPGFFTDVVFPSWEIFSHTAPLWPSLTKLRLIGVALNNSDLVRTCRIIGRRIRELFMTHVSVGEMDFDHWRECYPSWHLIIGEHRDALEFLLHLPALQKFRIEFCKNFHEMMWGSSLHHYLRTAEISVDTLREERCTYATCRDICYDLGSHYLNVIAERYREGIF